jgi:hypothetical protein
MAEKYQIQRRAFMRGVSGLLAALSASVGGPRMLLALERSSSSEALEQHLGALVEAYDAQGNHRSATSADNASAAWLAQQARQVGVEPSLESFALSRIDPVSCHLRIAGRRIEGVPLFDGGFTSADGVQGKLGRLGSDADIAVVETDPFSLVEPRREQGGPVAAARRSTHKGVVLVTRGTRPGLFLINAASFMAPSGPPMLQVSSVEGEWLKAQAEQRVEGRLVAHVERKTTQAFNVTARIAGRDPSLRPLVVSTPRSGWWQCASERGGGLACWLETMRVLAAANPVRECLFVAFSGHETGFIGIDAYLASRLDLMRRAQAWIQLGANFGAPRQPNELHTEDDELNAWAVSSLAKEGIPVDLSAARGSLPRAEAATLHRGGARYVALLCGSDVFHSAADRWPDAIDVAVLARYARAFAGGALELAQQA